MFSRLGSRRAVLRALAAGLVLTLVSAAMVSGQPTSATFYACLNENSQKLGSVTREPNDPPTCAKNEVLVSWNEPQTATIADGSVTTAKLADGAVVTVKLADEAVTSAKITDGAIATQDIADDAVTSDKIVSGAVGSSELADDAVTGAKILDSTITRDDIGDGEVTNADLAANAVATTNIQDEAVTSAKIKDGEITGNDLSPGAVGSTAIQDGAVAAADIADGAVTTQKQEANAAITNVGGATVTNFFPTADVVQAALNIPSTSSSGHRVLFSGQLRLACDCDTVGDSVNVIWEIRDVTNPLSEVVVGQWSLVLTNGSPQAVVPVSGLSDAQPGMNNYVIRVTYSGSNGTPGSVAANQATLIAVDLGQTP